jgi:hypothetical protein
MRFIRTTLVAALAAFAVAASATVASANNGLGPLPAAPSSLAEAFGGADVSDGLTPEQGFFFGEFTKGAESYGLSSTATVVDFTLPEGTTVNFNLTECGELDAGGFCLVFETNCEPLAEQVVSVSGNTVSFRLACEPGEGVAFEALVDSLLPEGTYDASVQFKVGVTRRAKDATNMWQLKLPDVFEVPGGIF